MANKKEKVKKSAEKDKNFWFNNPNIITNFIIGLIIIIILLSQSFAIKNNLSAKDMFGILNHNIIYLLVCIYFISLKTKSGKKYFDFINIILIILYFLMAITSCFTLFQSFDLVSLLDFMIDIIVLIYMFHTLLRGTRLWDEAKLGKSPFNEISNSSFFATIICLAILLLNADLISSTIDQNSISFDGIVLSILDVSYICLFVRYIYLYGEFLNKKKIDINNEGNFDEIKDNISQSIDDFAKEHDLDDKYNDIKEKVIDLSSKTMDKIDDIKDGITDIAEDIKLDEKINKAKDVVENFTEDVKIEAKELGANIKNSYEESELNEIVDKIQDNSEEIIDNIKKKVSSKPKSEIKSRKKNTKKNKKVVK